MHTKKRAEEYSQARKQKKDLMRTPLYRGVKDVKKLEKHITSFIKAIEKDSKLSDKEIDQHIKKFEEELHAEAKELRNEVKDALNHLMLGMKKLTELKIAQEKSTGSKHPLRNVFDHELRLADSMSRGMLAKLDSIEKMFKRME